MSSHVEGTIKVCVEDLLLLDEVFQFLRTAEERLVSWQVLRLQVRWRDEHIGGIRLLEDWCIDTRPGGSFRLPYRGDLLTDEHRRLDLEEIGFLRVYVSHPLQKCQVLIEI